MESTHSQDVIFNMDSLREFIKLIKRQGFENVDFYAVSELLQPPGELVTIVTDNGQEDLNLPYWQQLLNNSERISAENNLKNIFHDIITENGKTSIAFTINTEVELFTPFRKKELLMKSADDNRYYGRGIYQYDTSETNEIRYFKRIESITDLPVADEQYIAQQKYDDSIQQYYEENPTNTQDIKIWLKNYKNNQGITDNKPNYENYNKLKQCTFSIDFSVPTDDFKKDYPINIYVQEQIDNLLKWIQNDTELSININGYNYYKLSKKEKIYNNLKEAASNVYQDFEDTLYAFVPQNILDQMFIVLNAYKEFNNQVIIYSTPYLKAKQINTSLIGNELYDINKPEWWNYIYTKYNNNYYITAVNDSKIYYTEFNEVELKNNPGKIVIVRKNRPWNNEFWYNKYEQNIPDENNGKWDMNIKTGRHLYVQAGSLLKFNPGQSTENKNEIDDYWTDTTPGTFSIDENDGQKAHIITIRGFDQNGNFNNKNPIVGYTSQNDIPSNIDIDGAYKIGSNDYNLTPDQLAALQQQPDVPIYQSGVVIGYIKSKDIPKESDEDGAYEINDQKYNLNPNLIIPIAQANIIPVYLNNNNASITTHILEADNINLSSQGDLIINSTNEAYRFTDEENGDPATYVFDLPIDLLRGSIRTAGGIAASKSIKGYKLYGAVFNDYAEFRKTLNNVKPGQCVIDNDDGSLQLSFQRLQAGAQIVSDTYGFSIGETKEYKTPLAVSGRVLVYTYQSRENYHAGMAVCSAPNGTVDIMTREEIKEYPDCIIGIVSEIPDYEKWGSDQVEVNGRIWIKIK